MSWLAHHAATSSSHCGMTTRMYAKFKPLYRTSIPHIPHSLLVGVEFARRRPPCARPRGPMLLRAQRIMTLDHALDVLGVESTAKEGDVKRAFRKLALQHHPDVNPSTDEDVFMEIAEAYQIVLAHSQGKDIARVMAGKYSQSQSHSRSASGPKDWDFHDWYWDFVRRRRPGAKQAPRAPPPKTAGECEN